MSDRMVEILRTCNSCLSKPCATGGCPHNIEKEADKIETMVMALGYMPLEVQDDNTVCSQTS